MTFVFLSKLTVIRYWAAFTLNGLVLVLKTPSLAILMRSFLLSLMLAACPSPLILRMEKAFCYRWSKSPIKEVSGMSDLPAQISISLSEVNSCVLSSS